MTVSVAVGFDSPGSVGFLFNRILRSRRKTPPHGRKHQALSSLSATQLKHSPQNVSERATLPRLEPELSCRSEA
jgi:hypothetical protein